MPNDTHQAAASAAAPYAQPLLHTTVWPSANSPQSAAQLAFYEQDVRPQPGSLHGAGRHMDLQWHFHDMHKLLYAFEGGIEVESIGGRNLVPRQLAAWIPAGAPHCSSIHGIRWVSILFPIDMLDDTEGRVRTVMVSGLMREMMREAVRWPLHGPDHPVRASFYEAMAKLCGEWIIREAKLFLPTSNDPRVQRALDCTSQHVGLNLPEVCTRAGLSVRTLRRHLKAESGMTWEEYRSRSRLLQAISLLSETDDSVNEIAARCGFESQSAFARVFRLAMRESPREYRSRARDPASTDR